MLKETDGVVALRDIIGPSRAAAALTPSDVRGLFAASSASWGRGGADTRRVANLLVHRVACDQTGPQVCALANAIRALGFVKLADRIAERLATVEVEAVGDSLFVRTPYSPETASLFRAFRQEVGEGARFDSTRKANEIPVRAKRALYDLLKAHFAGATLRGPKGLVTL